MNKLEVGMYVRTKQRMLQPPQIAKIKKFVKDSGYKNQYYIELDHNLIPDYEYHIYQEDILKSSYNIIDLIEVRDIITYEYPMALGIVTHENVKVSQELLDILKNGENNHEYKVKSIVTKEQFEQMKYEVE